ncbi:hypothetical protein ACFVH6_32895 [Spirillospora sp. NPDC127200]
MTVSDTGDDLSAPAAARRFPAVVHRLHTLFDAEEAATIEHAVHVTAQCLEHLGRTVTGETVERLAAERLRARQATIRTLPPGRRDRALPPNIM